MANPYLVKEELIQYRHIRKWILTYSDGTVETVTMRGTR